ncbi:Pentatricopeptide repeat-containing protein, mitochondrial [Pseudocercospora fuligena]|uniref:Pentatricopeptide repeat-containing protein, mitochondrial n=1 Tax=Pseudocercospora fuligena TaxID=685502 RepID=A0A8H6RE34_9PEZI|nr:Pentatricopeptide repeat-containing protein, mitochondrial [Pseudocercospora fuligena]
MEGPRTGDAGQHALLPQQRVRQSKSELSRRYKLSAKPDARFRPGSTLYKSVWALYPGNKRVRSTLDLMIAARLDPKWYTQVSRLIKYVKDARSKSEAGELPPPTIVPEAIDELDRVIEELDKLEEVTVGCLRQKISPSLWPYALLWLLHHDPDRSLNFLLATFGHAYQHNICIQYSLKYLAWLYSSQVNTSAIDKLVDVAFALSDAWCKVRFLHGKWHGRWYIPIIPYCTKETRVRFFEDMKDFGKVYKVHWSTWLHFGKPFASDDQFDLALSAMLEAKSAGAPLDNWAFRSNCAVLLRRSIRQTGGLRACIVIVDNLVKIGMSLNNQLANIVMLNAVEAGDLKTAFSIYHSLVDHGLQADAYTYAILLKGCKATIDDAEILNATIRDALSRIDIHKEEVLSTEILHCLALHHTKHNPERAFEIVADAYAQLFDLGPLREIGLLPSKLSQIESSSEDRPLPTYYDMYIMIATYLEKTFQSEDADVKGAHALYQRFKSAAEAGIEPFVSMARFDHTFNAFLCTFIKFKRGLLYAAELVKDMQGKNRPKDAENPFCQPTVYTWSIFVDGFTRHGQMRLAEQVLNYMRTKGIQPNRVTYNTLVKGYAKYQDSGGMIDALRRMETDGHTWSEWTVKGTSRLRDQAALNEELKRQRQAQALDFTADLRGGLEQRLSKAQMEEVRERNVVEESDDERVSREYFQEDIGGGGRTYSAPPVDVEGSTETSYIPM